MCGTYTHKKRLEALGYLTALLNGISLHYFILYRTLESNRQKRYGLISQLSNHFENQNKQVAFYQRIITEPQVNPLPKAAKTTKSLSLILPCSQASVKAIITEAAVVFPYFMILLNT